MGTLAKNLKQLRQKHGLTQSQVADGVGISVNSYRQFEKGLRSRGVDTLIRFAEFYEVSTDFLLGLRLDP